MTCAARILVFGVVVDDVTGLSFFILSLFEVPGADVPALVDGDGRDCHPHHFRGVEVLGADSLKTSAIRMRHMLLTVAMGRACNNDFCFM